MGTVLGISGTEYGGHPQGTPRLVWEAEHVHGNKRRHFLSLLHVPGPVRASHPDPVKKLYYDRFIHGKPWACSVTYNQNPRKNMASAKRRTEGSHLQPGV